MKGENGKLASWKVTQSTTSPDFEWVNKFFKIAIVELLTIKVTVEIVQKVEPSVPATNNSDIHPLGHAAHMFDLDDIAIDKTCTLALGHNASAKLFLTIKPFDESSAKKSLDKKFSNPDHFNEKQFSEFYIKVRNAYNEFRSVQLNHTSKKEAIKSKIKLKFSKHSEDKDDQPVEEQGIFYPNLTCENFSRSWDGLDMKQKFKHYLALLYYTQPLVKVAALYKEKKGLSFRNFIDQKLLLTEILPFMENLYKKNPNQPLTMYTVCLTMSNYFQQMLDAKD